MACCPRLAPLRSPASIFVIEPAWAISENACLSKSPPPGHARPDDDGVADSIPSA